MKQALTLILLLLSINLLAQQLSGTYTIGINGTYTTINQAVDSLTANGVNGPVVFNIEAGTYNEQITIGSIQGTSTTNNITFQSANGDSTSVLITYTPQQILENTIRIENSNINFYSLSIHTTITSSYVGHAILLYNSPMIINNINISNCVISGGSSNTNANNLIEGYKTQYISFTNNRFEGWYGTGVFLDGDGFYMQGNHFESNIFNGEKSSQEIGYLKDIWIEYQNSPIIKNNILKNNQLRLFNITGNPIIQNNIIGGYFRLSTYQGTANTHALVSNNFIINRSSFSPEPTVYLKGNNINFYNNSISDSTYNNTSYTFQIENSTNCNIKNNIFFDKAYGILYYYGQNNSNISSNNNNFYTNGYYGKTYGNNPVSTLSAWKTLSGMDANSINIDPQFFSNTDLHISNPAMDGTGVAIALVTDDIDGETRPANPDMGADESNFSLIDVGVIDMRYTQEPPDSICNSGGIDSVFIMVKNFGIQDIYFNIDTMTINLNITGQNSSSIQSIVNSGILKKDSLVEILVTTSTNTNIGGAYSLSSNVDIIADSNLINNQSLSYSAYNYNIAQFPYFQDFENFKRYGEEYYNSPTVFNEGWARGNYLHPIYPSAGYVDEWAVGKAQMNPVSSGPANDHTLGNQNGHYIYATTYKHDTSDCWSPCVDLTNVNNPHLSFWYHMYGSQYGNSTYVDTFSVDVFNGNSWDIGVFSVYGEQHSTALAPWSQVIVNLSAYAGMNIKLRYRVLYDSLQQGQIAIDDIIIDAMPEVDLGNDTAICLGDQILLGYAPTTGYTYQWTEASQSTPIGLGSYYNANQAGTYIYKATNTMGLSAYDTINLSINQLPTPSLGHDTIICDTTSYILMTSIAYLSYFWQDSSTNNTFSVDASTGSGQYWVMVEDQNHCYNFDTVEVILDTCLGFSNNIQNSLSFSIYPNPSSKFFYIQSNGINGNIQCELYDMQGRQVLYKQLYITQNKRIKINTQKLTKGIYFIKLHNTDGVFTGKIVVY